jgi:hypothetical protein
MEVKLDNLGNIEASAEGLEAVRAQAAVLTAYIRSQFLLRLALYCLAAVFVLVAAGLVVFAPAGREAPTTVIGLALFAIAAGCAGFGTFAIKLPGMSAAAGNGRDFQFDTRRPRSPDGVPR